MARAALAQRKAVITAVPNHDWVRQSLEGLPPVTAGRFFLHGSHDRCRRRAGGISLEIDAGTAFGTGHHGTTEGCLMALDHIIKKRRPRRILDVGCGTGVLAIAAARATRAKALASDIDPEAVRVTRHNARTNGVSPAIAAITAAGLNHPRLVATAPYDLIFANILARPLVSLAQGLSLILASGGALVLSGLTLDQCRWILAAYRNRGLRISAGGQVQARKLGNSCADAATKRKAPCALSRRAPCNRSGWPWLGRSLNCKARLFLVAPHHSGDFGALQADVGQEPVIKLGKLLLGPAARQKGADAAHKSGGTSQALAVDSFTAAGDGGHVHSPCHSIFCAMHNVLLGYRSRSPTVPHPQRRL